ncbi:MAG: phage integrase N-terminal SAM-like domain-containing protein [Pseudomonadota bacterium]|nr:phage integrase N-terminal SAM-like domain-containing protein [Pseudomonadota bacterium]
MKTRSPFLNLVIEEMHSKRYAKQTIESYIHWIAAYINFHNKRHQASIGDTKVETFLNQTHYGTPSRLTYCKVVQIFVLFKHN